MITKLLVIIQKIKHHIAFILSIILSIVLIYNSESDQLTQLRLAIDNVTTIVKSPITKFTSLAKVSSENEILREQLMVDSLEKEALLSFKIENRELKELLDFKSELTVEMIPAKVNNMGLSSNVLSMTIDAGSSDGITKDNPVITPSGIVGKIISVGKNSSIVQLISDPDFRVGVRFLPSGATGILRWRANNICDVREVYKNSEISVGDKVVTSGFSDVFPSDLPVGYVSSVVADRNRFQKIVSVKIDEQLSSLVFVFVIINEELSQ